MNRTEIEVTFRNTFTAFRFFRRQGFGVRRAFRFARSVMRRGATVTAWGYANALTRQSQTTKYADERVALDRAAGKVLDITF